MKKYTTSQRLKQIMSIKGIKQIDILKKVQPICDEWNIKMGSNDLSQYVTGKVEPSQKKLSILAEALDTNEVWLMGYDVPMNKELNFDNGEIVDVSNDTILIPVLGTIKAGIAIEAQQDILEYIDIPKQWTIGGKSFYGLLISGDSMSPKYQEKDIVIFEQTNDYVIANGKDCAVMVNGFDATFKNVTISDSGITLVPLNLNNQDNYQPCFYNKEQIEQLPVKIIGIAREKRTRL